MSVDNEIREIVLKILNIDGAMLNGQTNFIDDIGVDSLIGLEIMAVLEKEYNIIIKEDDLQKMVNLDGIISVVMSRLEETMD